MDYVLSISVIVLSIFTIWLIVDSKRSYESLLQEMLTELAELRDAVSGALSVAEGNAHLSDAERSRMAWNADFDQRIAELRAEVNETPPSPNVPRSAPAQELHPQVHNLPHDAVYTTKPAYAHVPEIAE